MSRAVMIEIKVIFLVALLLLGPLIVFVPETVIADEEGDYTYTLSGSPTIASITGYNGAGGAISIPSMLGGYPVVAIGDFAFYSVAGKLVTSLTIPDGVTRIGNNAFLDCASMVSIDIPESVTFIGGGAFRACSSLTSIDLPEDIKSISNLAFFWCSNLTTFTMHDNITSIGQGSFEYCSSLTSIVMSNNLQTIGDSAFHRCSALTSIMLPEGLTSIGEGAFIDCSSITSISIPESLRSMGVIAFAGCSSLTKIDVNPNNQFYASVDGVLYNKAVTALIQCPNGKIGALSIPNTVSSIESQALAYCASLTSISLGDSVSGISSDMFTGCLSMTAINVTPENPYYACWDGVLYNKDMTVLNHCPKGKAGELIIPGGVTSTLGHAFDSCALLTAVIIPYGWTHVSAGTFMWCSGLTYVFIPDSVTSIGISAFQGCSALTSIIIPDGVNSIGELAFNLCSSLTSIVLPSSIRYIEAGSFGECTNLTSISFPNGLVSIGLGSFSSCSSLINVTITGNVTSIGDYAFWRCPSLVSITFLGQEAPTTVGTNWTSETNAGILGHAYSASDFPAPGQDFHGLTMGDVIPTAPAPPIELEIITGNAQVILAWEPPVDDGGSTILSYKIYRSTTGTGNYLLIASSFNLNYTDTNVKNDQVYWYKVSAVNAIGESVQSPAISASLASNNTMLYVGVGIVAVIAIIAVAFLAMRRKK